MFKLVSEHNVKKTETINTLMEPKDAERLKESAKRHGVKTRTLGRRIILTFLKEEERTLKNNAEGYKINVTYATTPDGAKNSTVSDLFRC